MATLDDPNPPGLDDWAAPTLGAAPAPSRPSPAGGLSSGPGFFRRLRLAHIMVSLLYFAVLFWAAKGVYDSPDYVPAALVALVLGLGVGYLAVWAALRLRGLAFVGWVVLVADYFAVSALVLGWEVAAVLLPVVVGAIVQMTRRRRSNDQEALLWVLTIAARRQMPLAPGARALAGQMHGVFRTWTESLADLLGRGDSLPEALDSLPMLAAPDARLLIRVGDESGDLAGGLREASTHRDSRLAFRRAVGSRLSYLGWTMAIAVGIMLYTMVRVIPRFEAIFREFGAPLPEVTVLVIRAARIITPYFEDLSRVQVDESFSVAIQIALRVLPSLALVAILYGLGLLFLQAFDRLFPRRHATLIFRSLALVVGRGRPIPGALGSIARNYPTSWVRRRLLKAAEDVRLGGDWIEVLLGNGLIRAVDAGVLDSAERAGNLAWALHELAEAVDRRRLNRFQAMTHLLYALAMAAMGSLVFFIGYAYFAPLISLISRLAG